jgi:hypothetical protein
VQTLTLRRSRRGDPGDLDGRWRVLKKKHKNPIGHWIRWSCEEVSGEGFFMPKTRRSSDR